MSLERIIRPFQNGDVFAPRSFLPEQQGTTGTFSDDVVVLDVTSQNPGDYVTEVIPAYTGFKVEDENIEDKSRRVTEEVRIENPDDSEQYVMVKRLKSASFVNARTGDGYNLKFADWDEDRS